MVPLLALAALQQKSLLDQFVPRPTGQNGYEEYLRAADLLRGPEAGIFANWTPGAKPRERDRDDPDDKGPSPAVVALYAKLNALSPLEVRREELRRFGRALDLVAQGNLKPVFDPRAGAGPDTLFPEFASFRYIARFAARAATVYAADGRTDRAVDTLLATLVCGDNYGRGVLISNLVAVASTSIALAALGDLLPRLSRTDALRLGRSVDALLARPAAIRAAMAAEAAFSMASLQTVFAAKGDLKGLFSSGGDEDEKPDPQAQRWARELSALSPAGRQGLARTFAARVAERTRTIDRILSGPERGWASGLAALEEAAGRPSDLADALIETTTPVFNGAAGVAVRSRTQLRLLALHARLIEHRWDYGSLPKALDETDPLTGEPYVYEVRPDGTVRLASKGIPETGEIELKYKRAVKDDRGVEP